mgnify:FL=1|tara:strand:- start:2177 stop:2395 length:219 start_codon:yes stop_codon:yes gene_type:complete
MRHEIMDNDLIEHAHYLVFETNMNHEDIAQKLKLTENELKYIAFKRKVKTYNFSYLTQTKNGNWEYLNEKSN